jgi:hypothetical protein
LSALQFWPPQRYHCQKPDLVRRNDGDSIWSGIAIGALPADQKFSTVIGSMYTPKSCGCRTNHVSMSGSLIDLFPRMVNINIGRGLTIDHIAFVVPTIDAPTTPMGSSVTIWVGIDGYTATQPLVQAGVDVEYATDGSLIYQAFTEVSLFLEFTSSMFIIVY